MRAGLIGIGLLGSALAERFLKAGIRVAGYDTNQDRSEELKALGGVVAGSAEEAVREAEVVVLCVPDSAVSASVVAAIAPSLDASAILIDTSTGEPEEMALTGKLVPRYVDATIAGSSAQVRNGDAVVMAGGESADVEACAPLFASFASRTFHTGPCGSGARMKLIVNLVLGLNRAAVAEGLAFAEACGVDPAMALEVLRAGPAFSTAMDRKGEKMIRRDWTPEARLRQHHKDVRLILAEGERHGIELPLSTAHEQLLEAAGKAGFAEADNAAVLEAYRLGKPR